MLNDYLPIIIIVTMATALGFLVIIIGAVFGPRRPSKRKASPYESGMIPYGPGTRRLSVRYYLVAVLFILFDIETVFFLPWAVVFRQLGWFALSRCWSSSVSFLLVLCTSGRKEHSNGNRAKSWQYGRCHDHARTIGQLVANRIHVADVVRIGLLCHRNDVGRGAQIMICRASVWN